MSKHKKKIDGDLNQIDPKEIVRSEENPRSKDFFKDKNFLRLKESVAKFGVIVPVIIKRLSKKRDGKRYKLIDGERRLKAAVDTNQQEIPAYILPPERQINILGMMFQIHMNQKEWDAVEQVRALEKIIHGLRYTIKEANETGNRDQIEKELVKQLIGVTGMNEKTAKSRVGFFRWPKKLRDYICDQQDNNYYSYAVEIEEKIVEPALRNFPDITEHFTPDGIREALFEKVTGGHVSRAEEIRDAHVITKRRSVKGQASKAKRLLLQFIKDESFTFPEAREQYFNLFPEEARKPALSPTKLINTLRTVTNALTDYTDATAIKTMKIEQRKHLRNALNELAKMVRRMLRRLQK